MIYAHEMKKWLSSLLLLVSVLLMGSTLAVHDPVVQAARSTGLPLALLRAVIQVESNGQWDAVSHAGAIGLMQVLPSTGEGVARELGISWEPPIPLPLRWGHHGFLVSIIQHKLTGVGIHTEEDGIFGPVTHRSVLLFQHTHHLPATGIIDAWTWRFLVKTEPLGTLGNPEWNVRIGAYYLRALVGRYGLTVEAIQRYNNGHGQGHGYAVRVLERWAQEEYGGRL